MLPHTLHRSGNPPTDESGKTILNKEVVAVLKMEPIRVMSINNDEVV